MYRHRFLPLLFCLYLAHRCAYAERHPSDDVDEPLVKPQQPGRLKVHLATWNVNSKKPMGSLEPLLGVDGEDRPDVIAISFQEVTMKPHKALFQLITDYDRWSYVMENDLISKGYYKIGTVRLIGILLNVYTLHEHREAITQVETNFFRTGFGGLYGSKGAVYLHFNLYGNGVCMINSHLPAHDEELKARLRDFNLIDEHRRLGCKPDTDRYTFWMGDLNFRLEDPTITAEWIKNVVNRGEAKSLLARDQLINNMEKGYIFNGFTEPHISFNPTFKFEVGTEEYNLKRRPAWTDRILYEVSHPEDLQVNEYTSLPRYDSSDHKPVVASYTIRVDKDNNDEDKTAAHPTQPDHSENLD